MNVKEDKLIEKMKTADRRPFDEANEHNTIGNVAIRLWCDMHLFEYATHLPIFEEEEHFIEYLDDNMNSNVEIPKIPLSLEVNDITFTDKEIRKIFWLSSLHLRQKSD